MAQANRRGNHRGTRRGVGGPPPRRGPGSSRPGGGLETHVYAPRDTCEYLSDPVSAVSNPGLLHTKLFPWTVEAEKPRFGESLRRLARWGSQPAYAKMLEFAVERLWWLARTCPNSRVVTLQTASRLAVGLGAHHATETSISFHPLYGCPWIPGSSVKGAVRAWAKAQKDEREIPLFGSEKRQGTVNYMDALPDPHHPWPVETDIMNVHYPRYYSGDGLDDRQDPNPVFFLTVKRGTPFLFPVVAQDPASLDKGVELLEEALRGPGAGAKTNSGYGRFTAP